jgi:predicted MFS family arabinose efflux permease
VAVGLIAVTILPAFMTGALAVQIGADVGLDLTDLGGLYAVLFGTSAVLSTPTGRLVQGWGWPAGIRLSAAASGLTLVAMALLPGEWWARWWPVAILFAVGGASSAMSQAASNLALARSVPPERYGLVFGLKHTAVPAAAMLGGLAVPTIGVTVGWRWAYVAAAAMAAVILASVPADRFAVGRAQRTADAASLRNRTPTPALAALASAAALGHTGGDALAAFVVPYAVSVGVSEGPAGLMLTLGSAAGLVVRLISGWLIDRRQTAGLAWLAALLGGGAVGIATMAAGGRPWLLAGGVLAFAAGWGWAGLLSFVVVRANPESAALASGMTNTGKYLGAGGGPLLFGFLADQTSFATAWWVVAAAMAGGAVVVALLRRTAGGRSMAAGSG